MNGRRVRRDGGFTLVETMVGIVVLTVMVLGVAAIFIQAGSSIARQKNKRVAVEAENTVRPSLVSIVKVGDQLVRQPDGFVLVESGTLSDFTAQFNLAGPKVEIRLIVRDASGVGDTTVYSA